MAMLNFLTYLKKSNTAFIAVSLLLVPPVSFANETGPWSWSPGDIIKGEPTAMLGSYYRRLVGLTPEGYFIVQDYFNTSKGFDRVEKTRIIKTDPFIVESKIDAKLKETKDIFKNKTCKQSDNIIYTEWYISGEKHLQISCEGNDKRSITWYKNGQKDTEKIKDTSLSWYQSGKKKIESSNGITTYWYESGSKETERNKDGTINWYENGQKKLELADNKKMGWYPNGQVSYEQDSNQDINLTFYENGQKKSEQKMKSKPPYTATWYSNGVQSSMTYFNKESFLQEGIATYWYESGQKKSEEYYSKHKKNGISTTWYKNGIKQSEGHFKDDLQSGKWNTWFETGQIRSYGEYKWGLRHGTWEDYDSAGNKEISKENAYITAPIIIGVGAISRGAGGK